jgi:hypothetical protein
MSEKLYDYEPVDKRNLPSDLVVAKKAKRFALAPAPFDLVMTQEEAIQKANQQILDGKAKKMYIFEIISVIEPITRVVDYASVEEGE